MAEAAVAGVLKLTFGLISNKVRSYGAEKLEDGGLTDQKFRDWIVPELDDIKFKIDANARRELFASVSSIQLGVKLLNKCFGKSAAGEEPSTFELAKNKSNVACTSTKTKTGETSVEVGDAVAVARSATGKMKNASSERLESAMKSFKDAGEKAQLAFFNSVLSPEERILACKVRIASGIIEHLDDPEFAATKGLHYLQDLHDLPLIQQVFSVQVKKGVKSYFKQDSRDKIVETVLMMNLILADYISNFTEQRMAVFDWPMIKCGKLYLHPIHSFEEMKITPPWVMVEGFEADVRKCAFNKNGDLVCFCYGRRSLQKLDKTTGKLQPYCPSPSQNKQIDFFCDLAVDEDDTVYALSGNENAGYTLSVYSADGNNTQYRTLEFFERVKSYRIKIAITQHKDIVICFQPALVQDIKVYLCDSNGQLKNNFVTGHTEDHALDYVFVSCNNEVVLVTRKLGVSNESYKLHVYTQQSLLQSPSKERTVTVRSRDGEYYRSLCYNKVIKVEDTMGKSIIGRIYLEDKISLEFLSDQTGELLRSYILRKTNLPKHVYISDLVCNSNGTLALVGKHHVLFLQTPSV